MGLARKGLIEHGAVLAAGLWLIVSGCGSRTGDLTQTLEHRYDVGGGETGGHSGSGTGGRTSTGGRTGTGGRTSTGGRPNAGGTAGFPNGGFGDQGGIVGTGGIEVGGGTPASCGFPGCTNCPDCWSLCLCEGGDTLSCDAQCFPNTDGGSCGNCGVGPVSPDFGFALNGCCSGETCGLDATPVTMLVSVVGGCQPYGQVGALTPGCFPGIAPDGQPVNGCCRSNGFCGFDLSTFGLGCTESSAGDAMPCFSGTGGEGGLPGTGGFAGAGGSIGGAGGAGGAAACAAEATSSCELCTCNACFDDVTTCYATDGCPDILECANRTGCTGVDCLNPDTCEDVITKFGGISTTAVTSALTLYNCMLNANCPCGFGGSSSD